MRSSAMYWIIFCLRSCICCNSRCRACPDANSGARHPLNGQRSTREDDFPEQHQPAQDSDQEPMKSASSARSLITWIQSQVSRSLMIEFKRLSASTCDYVITNHPKPHRVLVMVAGSILSYNISTINMEWNRTGPVSPALVSGGAVAVTVVTV